MTSSRTTRRGALALGAAVVAAAAVAATPGVALAADPYDDPPATCSAAPATVAPGDPVAVVGSGFTPGSTVSVTAAQSGVATTTSAVADANGAVSAREGTGSSAGRASYTLLGGQPRGGSTTCTTSVTVAAAGASRSSGTPSTRTQALQVLGSAVAGAPFTVHACGYAPGSRVALSDGSGKSLGSAPVGADGCFTQRITLDSAGMHTLYARGRSASGDSLVSTITVRVGVLGETASRPVSPTTGLSGGSAGGAGLGVEPAAVSRSGGLPFTGADGVGLMLGVGAALVAAGTGLLSASRRRRLLLAARSA